TLRESGHLPDSTARPQTAEPDGGHCAQAGGGRRFQDGCGYATRSQTTAALRAPACPRRAPAEPDQPVAAQLDALRPLAAGTVVGAPGLDAVDDVVARGRERGEVGEGCSVEGHA